MPPLFQAIPGAAGRFRRARSTSGTGEGIGHLPLDHETVATIEAHRQIVFHEHPRMQPGPLGFGLLQQGMAHPPPLAVGAHEQGRQVVIHQRHETEQLAALLEHPDAGVIEIAGAQIFLGLPPAGGIDKVVGLQGGQQPDFDDLVHVVGPTRPQHIGILVNNLNIRSLGEFDDGFGDEYDSL